MKGSDRQGNNDWKILRQRIDLGSGRQSTSDIRKNAKVHRDATLQHNAARNLLGEVDEPKKVHVSLSLTLPRLYLGRMRKKRGIIFAGLAVIGLAGLGAYTFIDRVSSNDTHDVLSDAVLEPEYDTVLPEGKREEIEGGKIGYDPQRKVASFKDDIGGISVTVSQQPLPEPFRANPDEEIKKVAENFSATEVINVASPRVYLGNDVKGPQTVIFHKNDVLVFILSSQPIDKQRWVTYIAELR